MSFIILNAQTRDIGGNLIKNPPSIGAYESYNVVPTVTTVPISYVAQTTAASGVQLVADGGSNVIVSGVCWATTFNPTITNSKTNDGAVNLIGVNNYTSRITGLLQGTLYHVRAYATNATGTGYGSDTTFTTLGTGTAFYVDPAGNDNNNGSVGSPWATLYHACVTVTTSGNIIHVNKGHYTVSTSCPLSVGVSIEGDGMATTTLTSNISGSYMALFTLVSSMGTNGNQHISGIYCDGNNQTTPYALQSYGRSNVSIYNCTFINFSLYGLKLFGNAQGQQESTSVTYATGISVHDCVITNCAYYQSGIGGGADIFMACLQDPQFYNNTITQSRPAYTNGCGIKTDGWTRGVTIHDNTITGQILSDKNVTNSWDFAIEMWGDYGSVAEGIHIYNNQILNWEIDISGRITRQGSYPYGCSIHDNYIACTSFCAYLKIGIILEANVSLDNIWIYHNHFKWVGEAINLYMTPYNSTDNAHTSYTNIYIYYNIFDQIGYNLDGNSGCYMFNARAVSDGINPVDPLSVLNHLYFYNNVILGTTRANSTEGACMSFGNGYANAFSYIYVVNNIIGNWAGGPLVTGTGGTMNYLYFQNNISNNNGNNNAAVISMTNTNYTNSGNLTTVPPFVSTSIPDYHLTASRLGLTVNLPTALVDYANIALVSPPTTGIYEYSGSIVAPVVTTTTIIAIAQTTATGGGNVTSDGGAAVTTKGVCWATTPNPTTANSLTNDGTGTGIYTSSLTGLVANTLYHVRAYATNSVGTSYGTDVSFTTSSTSAVLPTVIAVTVTAITQTTAISGGNVTTDGGATVTARGVCYNLTSYPSLISPHTNDGIGTGIYVSQMTGLLANTIYHLRSYATNSVGTAYGADVQFTTSPIPVVVLPTVTTTITNILQTSATSGGNVVSDGGASVTTRGVCWAITINPTTANSLTNDGTGTGIYVSQITGLLANTLYHVRAYATNSAGTGYGNDISFTTLPIPVVPPTVTTTTITNIAQTSATSGGNVVSDGGANVIARGVCWDMSGSPTLDNTHTMDGIGTGIFTSSITGLTPNTTYYVESYAINAANDTSYGVRMQFTTLPIPIVLPTVTTTILSLITQTTAVSGGNVTTDGGSSVTAKGVCWSTSANPTTANSLTNDGTGTGIYISSLTNLLPNTLYHVRAYATNSVGTSYGNDISFTTLNSSVLATVYTTTVTNIAKTTATSGGSITSDGGASVTARGVCWAITINPTIANSLTNDGSGTGIFISNITGLTKSTIYHVRAYATNSAGTAYGNDLVFTTDDVPIVATAGTTNKLQTSVTSGGNVILDGGVPVTAKGVCWSKTINPTVDSLHTVDGVGLGQYVSQITGLTPNTRYHVRAYATNAAGSGYGVDNLFTTASAPIVVPTVITSVSSTIVWTAQFVYGGSGGSSIKLSCTGNITDTGGSPITAKGICWGTSSNPTTSNHYVYDNTPNTGIGTFTVNIGALSPHTLYYIRAFAKNAAGIAYGNDIPVTTPDYLIQGN